jgi:excisionase family DNA binding protein
MSAAAEWGTLNEVAVYARCSPVTLAREIRAGRLKAYKLATRRVWRLRLSDVDRWMAGGSGDESVPYGIPPTTGQRF